MFIHVYDLNRMFKNMFKLILCVQIIFLMFLHTVLLKETINESEPFPISLLGQRAALMIRNRLLRRHERLKPREVCYDMVGCFPMPRTQVSPLKKPPQPPEEVDTKFLLINRNTSTDESQLLKYDDDQESLFNSTFDPRLATKIVVHGFKGSGKDKGALEIASSFLAMENVNVILVDWQKGAAGPSYVAAASNTQLVGRQLALLINDFISLGADVKRVHIIGFSLGAHIAGYAGRMLQSKGMQIGRITGLDPASPLFRELISASLSPLSRNDADYVDVIHTDGARFLSEGLGLHKAIGHTDFFPNGGIDQPGCNHVRGGSVLVSHFGGALNVSLVCNHVRAWQLFLESLKAEETGCSFLSYPCSGGWDSFQKGTCFPEKCTEKTCAKMGYVGMQPQLYGPLYLSTRATSPFCGRQLRATVIINKNVSKIRGYLILTLGLSQHEVHFRIHTDNREEITGGDVLHGLAVARGHSIPSNATAVKAHITCYILQSKQSFKMSPSHTIVNEVHVQDLDSNTWKFREEDVHFQNINGTGFDTLIIQLKQE